LRNYGYILSYSIKKLRLHFLSLAQPREPQFLLRLSEETEAL
jgi:hypothetical protein